MRRISNIGQAVYQPEYMLDGAVRVVNGIVGRNSIHSFKLSISFDI